MRDALREHFTSCGEITRISVPRADEGGLKGFVFCAPNFVSVD